MNIRQEVEAAIATFAAAQSPTLAVAYEGVPFVKPSGKPYLEIIFLNNTVMNATVDATRARVYGTVQIGVYVPDGKGSKQLDDLCAGVAALFPVWNKALYGTFSVEQPPNVSAAMIDVQYRWAAVRIKYRQEL